MNDIAGFVEEQAAYDKLPPKVRAVIDESDFMVSAPTVLAAIEELGLSEEDAAFELSLELSRRRDWLAQGVRYATALPKYPS